MDLVFNQNIAAHMADGLIKSGAYKIVETNNKNEWFTWKSGISAPVYCNTRQLLSYPKQRDTAIWGIKAIINECFSNADGVIGLATAGIGWATIIGHLEGLPTGYIRSSAKAHGLGKMIEYESNIKKNIIVIDDLIASGESIKRGIDLLNNDGFEILGVISIINWGFPIMYNNIPYPKKSLCSYPNIVDALNIDIDAKNDLISFYKSPHQHQWQSKLFG